MARVRQAQARRKRCRDSHALDGFEDDENGDKNEEDSIGEPRQCFYPTVSESNARLTSR